MKPRPADVIRSLLYYAAFFGGSFCLALAASLVPVLGPRWAIFLAHVWSRWQRTAARYLLGIHIRVEGTLPQGAVLVAGKHETMFEAIDLPTLLDNPVPFAKAELLRLPLWGRVGRCYGLVPVERGQGAKALRAMRATAAGYVAKNRPLVIFPEGTRVPHGTRPPLQSGFAGLYKILDLPVVPFAVNSGAIFSGRWKRPGTITVRFGDPIPAGLSRAEIEERVHTAINVLNTDPAV
ncbi:MAG: hypothetical protein RLZZ136_35 [Pseudomonadota bacterium]